MASPPVFGNVFELDMNMQANATLIAYILAFSYVPKDAGCDLQATTQLSDNPTTQNIGMIMSTRTAIGVI